MCREWTNPTMKRKMRRRSVVEPVIGHIRNEYRMGRNHLASTMGNAISAILVAAGYNLALLLTWLRAILGLMLGSRISGHKTAVA